MILFETLAFILVSDLFFFRGVSYPGTVVDSVAAREKNKIKIKNHKYVSDSLLQCTIAHFGLCI